MFLMFIANLQVCEDYQHSLISKVIDRLEKNLKLNLHLVAEVIEIHDSDFYM